MQRWSTDIAPPKERLDYWIDAICAGFLTMTATSKEVNSFSAQLLSQPLGAIKVNQVQASSQQVYRDKQCLSKDDKECFYLLRKKDSSWYTEQDQRRAQMNSCDLVLLDASRCYYLGFPSNADTISLELPSAWLKAWIPHAQKSVSYAINGQQGWGLALSNFVAQWSPQWAEATTLPTNLLTDHLGMLLNLSVEPIMPPTSKAGDRALTYLATRIEQYLEQHFYDPDLCADRVALQLGVSSRTIHRAVALQNKTLAHTLLHIRTKHAKRLLQDRQFKHLSISEIGRRVGYLDPSQFSRIFKRATGESPNMTRQQQNL